MDQAPTPFPDFEAFWRHFMTSHRSAAVRYCHVAALGCGLLGLGMALRKRRLWPAVLGAGGFAALAILSHPLLTGTWPENFGHPVWAARAFLRLCRKTVTGSIYEDLPAD